jgi:hypothetical protein
MIAGWLLAWLYFRSRIWVMEERLLDYAERRGALNAIEERRLVCPVCHSRALRRSNKHSLSVFLGRLIGRAPYRCSQCFQLSLHWSKTRYWQSKQIDTRRVFTAERKRFAEELRVTRKMVRLYPDRFEARPGAKLPGQVRNKRSDTAVG